MTNIFRKARQLLRDKPVLEMNGQELEVVKIATMPLLLLRQFNDLTIDQGLEELAQMFDEASQNSRGNRRRKASQRQRRRGVEQW